MFSSSNLQLRSIFEQFEAFDPCPLHRYSLAGNQGYEIAEHVVGCVDDGCFQQQQLVIMLGLYLTQKYTTHAF